MRPLAVLATALAIPAATGRAEDAAPAEVVVLATLHQLHGEIEGYSFDDLSTLIERLEPDVLAVELTPADLASRRDQAIKQEYPRVVFPLLDRHAWETVPLEPPPPLYDELVGLFRGASADLRDNDPSRAETFDLYLGKLYEVLLERWTSAAAVNSGETDALFEAKHRFQSALLGRDEARAWEAWNAHFLARILDAAERHRGRRIVVLVGAEHGYWLRARLREKPVSLLDAESLLARLEPG